MNAVDTQIRRDELQRRSVQLDAKHTDSSKGIPTIDAFSNASCKDRRLVTFTSQWLAPLPIYFVRGRTLDSW